MTKPVYIIAEAGVNHDGSVDDALRLIDAAAEAGADCIKFQVFSAEALTSVDAQKADYQKRASGSDESQREMLKRLELPTSAFALLMAHAKKRQIDFLSTPFDPASLVFLINELGLTQIKVGSGDLTNAPMLLDIAKAGRNVILSTGMATLEEVKEALSVLVFGYARRAEPPSCDAFAAAWADTAARSQLHGKVELLHCTTEYPAPGNSVNLRAMDTLAEAFGLPVGYSDHTLGIEVAVAAVARGAVTIEKHLTLDRSRFGPDHAASLDPNDFRAMVRAIRLVEGALGDGRKVPQPAEIKNIPIARKALVAARPIAAGEAFSWENIAVKRPACGLPPSQLWSVLGKVAPRSYRSDEPIEP
jgi:N-acetylneuraminate synthase